LKQLLLFDIDGTLIDTGGVGLAALHDGLRLSFPSQAAGALPALDLRGATDAGVIRTLFTACAIADSPHNRGRFVEAYLQCLTLGLQDPVPPCAPRMLPGVDSLLAGLAQSPDRFTLGLLTGNLEAGAFAKLRRFAIDRYFRFGAYGLDHEDRLELGPIALERAKLATGRHFRPSETVIIGDTPRDIACARAFGARCIAVSTGGFPAEELSGHQPDALLPGLHAPAQFIGILDTLLAS
jgi:phosphoglycolate phosphatase-like HAD superfamily hydrolase